MSEAKQQELSFDEVVEELEKEYDRVLGLQTLEKLAVKNVAVCKQTVDNLQGIIDARIAKVKANPVFDSRWERRPVTRHRDSHCLT